MEREICSPFADRVKNGYHSAHKNHGHFHREKDSRTVKKQSLAIVRGEVAGTTYRLLPGTLITPVNHQLMGCIAWAMSRDAMKLKLPKALLNEPNVYKSRRSGSL